MSTEENLAIRERALDQLEPYSKRLNLNEMVVYLIDKEQYPAALKKIEVLSELNESEANLFNSHLLRHGLGVEMDVHKAFELEVRSASIFDKTNPMNSYSQTYEFLDSYDEGLFDYEDGSFEMNHIVFIWYIANIDTSQSIEKILLSLHELNVFDSVER